MTQFPLPASFRTSFVSQNLETPTDGHLILNFDSYKYLGFLGEVWVFLSTTLQCHILTFLASLILASFHDISFEGPKPATRGGVKGSRSKFLRNSNRRPISQNLTNPQAFWPSFGIAIEKLNQYKRHRTSERTYEANRKQNRKTAELVCLDRSDRSRLFRN